MFVHFKGVNSGQFPNDPKHRIIVVPLSTNENARASNLQTRSMNPFMLPDARCFYFFYNTTYTDRNALRTSHSYI